LDRGLRHSLRKDRSMKTNHAVILSLLICVFPLASRADIFQWEYINPANPSLGKQPSTMLAPEGAGLNAAPGVNLASRNLTMAYLIGADLSAANARFTNFYNADRNRSRPLG
jgi:hypothetical protein